MVNLTATWSSLITANHILHYHEIVDAFGHISVRNPNNAATFFMSDYLAPALVSSPDDLVEYWVENGSSVVPNGPRGQREKFIHSETLKRFPKVNCVLHSHSEAVIPYSIVEVPEEPAYHMAGFLGTEVPVFDIEDYYDSTETHDLLVYNTHLGGALASLFSDDNSSSTEPAHTVVLMRGHGFTTVDTQIERAVYRAYYAQANARIQNTAIDLASSADSNAQPGQAGNIKYLTPQERIDAGTGIESDWPKAWKLWVREVEVAPLYTNSLGSPPGA